MPEQKGYNEAMLLRDLRNGCARAFEQIFERYWEPLYRTAKSKLQLGRSDAFFGLILRYDGKIVADKNVRSKLWLNGDIRDIEVLNFASGAKRVLISRNDDHASVYRVLPRKEFFVNAGTR